MLILCRKINESIVIDGNITVKILRIDGDQVRLGIQAPIEVPVHRHEVYEEIQRTNREAATHVRSDVPRLPSPPRPAPAAMPHPPSHSKSSQPNPNPNSNPHPNPNPTPSPFGTPSLPARASASEATAACAI